MKSQYYPDVLCKCTVMVTTAVRLCPNTPWVYVRSMHRTLSCPLLNDRAYVFIGVCLNLKLIAMQNETEISL